MPLSADPYLLPNGTLQNKFGITDSALLARRETDEVALRLTELQPRPGFLSHPYTPATLQQIHYHLFQDVYAWAGQFRSIQLHKALFEGSSEVSSFSPPGEISSRLDRILAHLKEHRYLCGRSPGTFAAEGAKLLSEINAVHPFREGNGRTQRAFLDLVARGAGYELHWEVVTRERMIRASIEAHHGRLGMMIRLFSEIIDPDRIAPIQRAIDFLSAHKPQWNDFYIARSTPGETYTGHLVGRDGAHGMVRVGEDTLIVVDGCDIPPNTRNGDLFTFTAGKAREDDGRDR